MSGDTDEKGARPQAATGRAKTKKNAALAAALRANLQRRKARERALRQTAPSPEEERVDEESENG